jgi:hypothetical protein
MGMVRFGGFSEKNGIGHDHVPGNKKARRLAGGHSMIGLLFDQSRHRAASVGTRHHQR